MDIKVKKENSDGLVRLETSCKLNEIMIKEDLLNPSKELIQLCFLGKNSSLVLLSLVYLIFQSY